MDGLVSRLETIQGLRVLTHPPVSVGELPAAVLLFESREPALTLSGERVFGQHQGSGAGGAGRCGGGVRGAGRFHELGGRGQRRGGGGGRQHLGWERRLRASRVGGQRWAAKAVGRRVRGGDFHFAFTKSA